MDIYTQGATTPYIRPFTFSSPKSISLNGTTDQSGNGNNGTISGTPSYSTDIPT